MVTTEMNQWCTGRKPEDLFDTKFLLYGTDSESTQHLPSVIGLGAFLCSPLGQNLIKQVWEWDGRAGASRERRSQASLLIIVLRHYGSNG